MSASGLQETVCGACPADGDLAVIWRQKRWLEKVDGLVRREDCWATTRTSCAEARFAMVSHPPPLHTHSRGCRIGGVRCATRCRGQQPQQGVLSVRSLVSKTVSSGALLLDCFTICGKNDRTMYRLGLLFEMEKAFRLTKEE